ncbi:DUF1330 domain-containing protein [Actinomadura sp. 6K520]|jgi:uncharacterized protein (DUF1330 family)|uniref:DUF1330 domain-containing protein n=1 Tax=Actinomadura sp. 6K520 TaxID=2530364 RepID=UPI001047EF1B|nr:DUF1330 domain-containing protein [Actinomadura sp. 6K520]TDE26344.1 DUF1330 domain-containing protein [Actinomadura sp. 6K520]
MTAYALAHLHPPATLHEEVFTYMERIQATLDPFGGRFLVHGSVPEVMEGPLDGAYVLIEFPDMDNAKRWYESDGYQAILPMRTDHMKGTAVLLPGVPEGYDPAATAAAFRTAQTP